MSLVNVLNVDVLNNPAKFTDPFQFEITFECLADNLENDLEWKLIYIGSAEDDKYDQILDTILVGPVPFGVNKFLFQADAPNVEIIPETDLLGVTVILITCSYKDEEFVRVGYYLNNEYTEEELRLNPPLKPVIEKIQRNILSEKPRVTKIPIKWDLKDVEMNNYVSNSCNYDNTENCMQLDNVECESEKI